MNIQKCPHCGCHIKDSAAKLVEPRPNGEFQINLSSSHFTHVPFELYKANVTIQPYVGVGESGITFVLTDGSDMSVKTTPNEKRSWLRRLFW